MIEPISPLGASQPTRPSQPLSSSAPSISTDTYFDLGAWQSWNFVNWTSQPPTLNKQALDTWLQSFSSQVKNAGLSQVTLSFGQLADLSKILQGDLKDCEHSDAFYMLYQNTGGLTITSGGKQENILQYMTDLLTQQGINVFLSFGGQAATEKDFNFGFSSTNTPAQVANEMIQLIKMYHIKGLDFDLEAAAQNMVKDNGANNLAQFFALFASRRRHTHHSDR